MQLSKAERGYNRQVRDVQALIGRTVPRGVLAPGSESIPRTGIGVDQKLDRPQGCFAGWVQRKGPQSSCMDQALPLEGASLLGAR